MSESISVVCDSEASSRADPDGIEPVSQELTSEQDLTGGDDMPEWIETHTVDELKTIMECVRTCDMCSELIGYVRN